MQLDKEGALWPRVEFRIRTRFDTSENKLLSLDDT